jgi:hypothetical protein
MAPPTTVSRVAKGSSRAKESDEINSKKAAERLLSFIIRILNRFNKIADLWIYFHDLANLRVRRDGDQRGVLS